MGQIRFILSLCLNGSGGGRDAGEMGASKDCAEGSCMGGQGRGAALPPLSPSPGPSIAQDIRYDPELGFGHLTVSRSILRAAAPG